jgi:hypothetical protein
MLTRALAVWFVMLVVASANGALRQAVLVPAAGDVAGRAISTLILAALIALLTWMTIGWIRPRTTAAAWLIGALWVALTLTFEFLVGHFLFGTAWNVLLEDYDILRGRIWILVVIVTAIAPRVCASARGLLAQP